MRPGFLQAYLRLLMVQGSWNYERMIGVGMGHAATPLLEDLAAVEPARHAEASVRSAEYFNSHPYLAGLALGALVRAEYDQAPGPQVERLRTALTSPLGSLGDQFFWAGLQPAVMGGAIVGVLAGYGWWAVGLALIVYNAARLATGAWALRTGLASGLRVGQALTGSWLPASVAPIGLAAGFLVGMALPLSLVGLLDGYPPRSVLIAAVTMLLALASARWLGPRVNSMRFAVAAIVAALIFAWSRP